MSATEYPCKVFDRPFVWLLSTTEVFRRCANCFGIPDYEAEEKLSVCGKCRLFRYCCKPCQLEDWFHHRTECRQLEAVAQEEEPRIEREILFFGRLIHAVKRAVENDKYQPPHMELRKNGIDIFRDYDALVTNEEHIKESEMQMAYFAAVKSGINNFFGEEWLQMDDDNLLDIFCRKIINSHEISDNKGNRIGQAIDLGVAAYDHSCRPNVGVLYDGKKTVFRALEPGLGEVDDVGICFLSYVELMQPKAVRKAELKRKYHFDCECERCISKEDDLLTSIKCPKDTCRRPVLTVDPDKENTCDGCGEAVSFSCLTRGMHKMAEVQNFVDTNSTTPKSEWGEVLATAGSLITDAQEFLPNENVHLADLYCLYVQYVMMSKSNLEDGILYALEALPCLRLCYPANYKPLGFHLLKIAYLMILLKRFTEPIPYVQDALRIFTVWFGAEHAYPVQVDALLDRLKSDDDLSRENFDQYFRF